MKWKKNKGMKRPKLRKPPPAPNAGPSVSVLERMVGEEIELTAGDIPVQQETRRRSQRSTGTQRQWTAMARLNLGWSSLWLMLVLATLHFRTAWPVDETGFLAVAWEMWLRQDSVVPVLNGYLYMEQPPLLFWLVHAGWQVVGVNDWWPRLLPPIFGFLSLFLCAMIARQLWPQKTEVHRYAPFILLGIPVWALATTLALPVMALVCFTLLAMHALLLLRNHGGMFAWLLLGLALGGGSLAVGLSLYWYVLPVALLAPLWVGSDSGVAVGKWYGNIIKALIIAGAIFGAWAYNLSESVGQQQAIEMVLGYLWPQVLLAFSTEQPVWWYLFITPLVLLPWSIWPLPWMRLWSVRQEPINSGIRFCLVWGVGAIVALSFMPAKQVQFLLPIIPAFSLLVAHFLMDDDYFGVAEDRAIAGMNFPIIVVGGVLSFLPGLPKIDFLPAFLWDLSPFVGIGIAVAGIVLSWLPMGSLTVRTMNIALSGIMLIVFSIFFVGWRYNQIFDVHEAAHVLAQAQQQQRSVAHVGPYHGQYHFAGRLTQSIAVLNENEVATWAQGHRDGLIITYANGWQPSFTVPDEPVLAAQYGRTKLLIWKSWYVGGGSR